MDKPVLGIRIANGTYFPILGEDEGKKKKIILSPVKEDQKDVKIDIFRGEGDGMFNPSYVASLILNNISHDGGRSVEIELIIGINQDRILDAEAYEPASDNRQFLSISLDSIDEDAEFYDMPEMSDSDEPFLSASLDDEDFGNEDLESLSFKEDELEEAQEYTETEDFEGGEYAEEEDDSESDAEESAGSAAAFMYSDNSGREKKSNLLKAAVIILAIIFIILTALLLYTLLMKPALAKNREAAEQPVPIASVQPPPPAPVQPQIKTEPAVPAVPAPPVQPEVKAEPAAPPPAPAVPEEIRYRIKWGDTLWDISNSYYRTPWLYKKIARDNNIKNPDRIYAGRYLAIKEQ